MLDLCRGEAVCFLWVRNLVLASCLTQKVMRRFFILQFRPCVPRVDRPSETVWPIFTMFRRRTPQTVPCDRPRTESCNKMTAADSTDVTAVICCDGSWKTWDCYSGNIVLWPCFVECDVARWQPCEKKPSHISLMAICNKRFELDLWNRNWDGPRACEQVACTILFVTEHHKYGDDANLCGWVQNLWRTQNVLTSQNRAS